MSRARRSAGRDGSAFALLAAVLLVASGLLGGCSAVGASDRATFLSSAPSTLDPAAAGDAGSAAVIAQLYETLTAFDADLVLRPALAASWETSADGRVVRFRLRDGLVFSDGTPIGGADVVRSWLRIIDPRSPSPLSSLALDIAGAEAYLAGESGDPSSIGLSADGNVVEVRLARPTDFPSIVASPTFAIVPTTIDDGPLGRGLVGSGGYLIENDDGSTITLRANDRYWAGRPAIATIELLTDAGVRSPLERYLDGDLDYVEVAPEEASWIAYDPEIGPALVRNRSISLDYYGFDTTRPPFDEVLVRRAFAAAVDWRRLVTLARGALVTPADGMVPPGLPDRPVGSFMPTYDPAAARRLFAEAGYPGGRGFAPVTIVSGGAMYDLQIASELESVLGITVEVEQTSFEDFFARLGSDPPAFWQLSWIADYPSPNDFLGILLGTGRATNYTGWSSTEFDAAIGEAVAAPDASSAATAYARASAVVAREVPAIPLSYSTSWALVRPGLQGAIDNGLGFVRLAGLAWADR